VKMKEPTAHAWLRPKLAALVAEAENAGFAREVAVAVLIDIVTGTEFNLSVTNPEPQRGRAAAAGYRESTITED
jgi:hypothetical protein